MSILLKTIFIVFTLLGSLEANTKISQKEMKEIAALNVFQGTQIIIEEAYDMDSLYLLKINVGGNLDTVYLSKDKKYLIAGNVIGTKDGKKLGVPTDVSVLQGKEAFVFGKGKDEYILFTDPECPYCKRFESHLSKVEDKVKIRVFYFPLSFHPNARNISLYVMSQNSYDTKVEAFLNTTKDTPAFKNRDIPRQKLIELEGRLNEQIALGNKVGVAGTPFLFDKDGNIVSWIKMLEGYGVRVR